MGSAAVERGSDLHRGAWPPGQGVDDVRGLIDPAVHALRADLVERSIEWSRLRGVA